MSRARVIPSLDGLRALAVFSVILFHCKTPLLDTRPWLAPVRNGALGVTCFFVISGFLITRLLLEEYDTNHRIDLGRFYLRRAFRIFPPFYVYLAVVGVLALMHVAHVDLRSYLLSAAYLRNYAPHPTIRLIEHTWSLSLEEQFYLLWPLCLAFFRPKTCLRIALVAILISPLLRVATYALVPSSRDHINFMLHARLDAIMMGALLTLAQHQGVFRGLLRRMSQLVWLVPAVLYCLAQPMLTKRLGGPFTLLAGFSLDALCCGIILLYATEHAGSALGRLLNMRWLRHLGIVSYSLYLWQQMFSGENTRWFPLNVVVMLVVAEASFWLVERPSLALRNRLFPSRSREADPAKREESLTPGQLTPV